MGGGTGFLTISHFFFFINDPNLNSKYSEHHYLTFVAIVSFYFCVCVIILLVSVSSVEGELKEDLLAFFIIVPLDNLCLAHSRLLVNICWINDRIQFMRVSNPWWPLKSFPNWTSCPSVSVMVLDLWIDSHPHLCPLLSLMDAITCYQ